MFLLSQCRFESHCIMFQLLHSSPLLPSSCSSPLLYAGNINKFKQEKIYNFCVRDVVIFLYPLVWPTWILNNVGGTRFNLFVVEKFEPIIQSHASLHNCAHLCAMLILHYITFWATTRIYLCS